MRTLTKDTPILIDSGGQYTMGTTDVTRTWWFGEATEYFKVRAHTNISGAKYLPVPDAINSNFPWDSLYSFITAPVYPRPQGAHSP